MSGSIAGGKQAAMTNKKSFGNDFYKRIGRMGGSVRCKKGFGVNRELARRAGKIGGTISRRTKKVPQGNDSPA